MRAVFLLLLGLAFVGKAFADEQCYEYTKESSIVVGIDVSEKNDSDLENIFSSYIGDAKKNDINNISRNFTSQDGSKISLTEGLAVMPDKFSFYSEIQSFSLEDKVYRWGNYRFIYANYKYTGGKLRNAEAFFCGKKCLMSNIFEHTDRDEGIDLISRLLYQITKGNLKKVNCPNMDSAGFKAFSLLPKYKASDDFPFKVYIEGISKPKIKTHDIASIKGVVSAKNQTCGKELFQESEIFLSNGEVNSNLITKNLEACAVNTKSSSLIPVVFIANKKTHKRFLSVESYLSRLKSITKFEKIMHVYDNKDTQAIISRVSFSSKEQALLVIPFVKTKDGMKFDWSFFSRGAGELLTNTSLTKFLNLSIPSSDIDE